MTQEEISKIILKSPNKQCYLDPMPTWLVKECVNELLPLITEIVNASLKLGNVPEPLKHVIIRPLLKKLGLELEKNNYIPVSNLSFISKLIESAVVLQYVEHLQINNLQDDRQSAYKQHHSTETVLLKVLNDILMKIDQGQVVMLVLLDLSAAFDTIDHKILLKRLEKCYGVRETALSWFKSYLSHRTQSVVIGDEFSSKKPLNYGVPQGSKLGPVMFTSYYAPASEVVRKHNMEDEKYADDKQLIHAFSPNFELDQNDAVVKMNNCIRDIRRFLEVNKLSNNRDKTEFLLLGTTKQLAKLKINSITVGDVNIKAVDKARNLGVIFDNNLNMKAQVSNICKTGYLQVKKVASIRKNLNENEAKTITYAFVTSTLDYGNSLLYGIHKKQLNRLQLLQNSAARVICNLRKFDKITETRKKLHWLPVEARIEFKVLSLTWKALNDMSPHYIKNLLHVKINNRKLRNNNDVFLTVPKTKLKYYGDRAFQKVSPSLWNQLPGEIKNAETINAFQSKLKTHLFNKFYLQPTT